MKITSKGISNLTTSLGFSFLALVNIGIWYANFNLESIPLSLKIGCTLAISIISVMMILFEMSYVVQDKEWKEEKERGLNENKHKL